MAIDWTKVGESAVLMLPTALVSGYVGARIKSYLNRARPQVSVTGFRIGSGADLTVTTVDIPPALSAKLREYPWTPGLHGTVNAGKLPLIVEKLSQAIDDARRTVTFLRQKLSELPTVAKSDMHAKVRFLNEITEPEYRIIDAALTGALVRQDLRLTLPPDSELEKNEKIVEFVERAGEVGGYCLNFHTAWYNLCYRDRRDNPFLLPAAKAFAYFWEPAIQELLQHVLNDITQLAATGNDVLAELRNFCHQVTPLIVEVRITNSGRSSMLFSPWAVLEVFHPHDRKKDLKIEFIRSPSFWSPDDPLKAAEQEKLLLESPEIKIDNDTYFVVEPGNSAKVVYRSQHPVVKLSAKHPDLLQVMKMELFKAKLHVKRGDVRRLRSAWIHSAMTFFGKKAEDFPTSEITAATAPRFLSLGWCIRKVKQMRSA